MYVYIYALIRNVIFSLSLEHLQNKTRNYNYVSEDTKRSLRKDPCILTSLIIYLNCDVSDILIHSFTLVQS